MPTITSGGPSSGWEEPAYEGGEAPAQEPVEEPAAAADEAPEEKPVKRVPRQRKKTS
jgi:hypothetical protein